MFRLLLNQFVLLFIFTFLTVFITTHYWIKRAKKAGLIGTDVHKTNKKEVAEMGGITVLLGFIISSMFYIAIRIFDFHTSNQVTSIMAILTAILIAGTIGIMDDVLGWKIGLRQWQKPVLTLLVAAPIMAINSGHRIMHIPFIGEINFGLLYPLIIVPLLIVIGTNGFNMLAGYNGLEAGQGILILSALAYFAFITGSAWLTIIALCMVFALLGFLMYNYFPAKVFPGDTLTYSVGALSAIIAILGNLEKVWIILFMPYIIEFFLKLRGLFQKESFSKVIHDGTLIPRYKLNYGLEHLVVRTLNNLKIKTTEKKVVHVIYGLQVICIFLAFI